MTIELVPFTAEHLAAAGDLLARRHIRDREVLPDLPAHFEHPTAATVAVSSLVQRPQSSGIAATDQGRLVGYLIGDLQISEVWERSVWVQSAGCAANTPELVHRMYAALGDQWVARDSCFNHFVMIPTADPALIHAWFMLGFGVQQVHALMRVSEQGNSPANPATVVIRRAQAADREALREFSDVIWLYQLHAPI